MVKLAQRMAVVVTGLAAAIASTASAAPLRINGAGATFPQPLYERWVVEYQKVNPAVQVDYRAIGSGAGIKAITDRTVHFAGSDAPLNKKETEAMGGDAAFVEIPVTAGGVVPAYNLPGIDKPVNFTGELLADIYLGKLTKWNDPRLAAINEGLALPDLAITPVWRSDGSGTTHVFTNYLAGQSAAFKGTVGMGKSVAWKIGQGGRGNPGVAAVVSQTPGALGYIELNFATGNKISFGAVKNRDGKFVLASPESVSAAGAGAAEHLKGPRLSYDIWDQPGEGAYPISAFTYLIVYSDLRNLDSAEQAKGLVGFLRWTLGDGQKLAASMDYAPMADSVRAKALAVIDGLTFKGETIAGAAR